MCYLVVEDDAIIECFVEHLLVPLLEAFRLRNFLVRRMAVEDVVIALARRTRPDVSRLESKNRQIRSMIFPELTLQRHHLTITIR